MDKYNVQNGRWREKEQEITTITRVIYTQNKKCKKEYNGGKVTGIYTTSNKEPESTVDGPKDCKDTILETLV